MAENSPKPFPYTETHIKELVSNLARVTVKQETTTTTIPDWNKELIEETATSLKDMAEIEGKNPEAEATAFAAKLFLEITGNDWEDAQAMAQLLESYFQAEGDGSNRKPIY